MEQLEFPGKKTGNSNTSENLNQKFSLPSVTELLNSFHEYEDVSGWTEEGENPPEEYVLQNNKAGLENGKLMKKFMASFDGKKLSEALESSLSRKEALSMIDDFICNISPFGERSRAYKIFLDRVAFCFLKESFSKNDSEKELPFEELKELSRKKLRIYGVLIKRLEEEKDPRYGYLVTEIKKELEHADMGNFIIESTLNKKFHLIKDIFVLTHNFSDRDYQKKLSKYFIPIIDQNLKEKTVYFNDLDPRMVFSEIIKDAYVEKMSESYKIPINRSEHMVTEWMYAEKIDIMENLRAIETIESQIPGGTKRLNETYNIEFFSRYPVKLLEAQLREEEIQQPYGVIIYPKDDYNGAFSKDTRRDGDSWLSMNEITPILGGLYTQTRGHHGLKLFEAGSKIDLARIFIQLDNKYGKEHKIDFAVIGAHGSPEGMNFGQNWKDLSHFELEDFDQKPGMKKVPGAINAKRFFQKNPKIVLISCSTGADLGLGEKLSKEYDATVIAPKVPTALKRLDVKYGPSGDFNFDAEYYDKDSERVIRAGK